MDMRIAQVAPLYESVPPQLYGGTERVVSYVTEALVADGHDVTLFASGDSVTAAELVPVCERALRLDPGCVDPYVHHILLLEAVAARASEFDIIHYHVDYHHFPLSRRRPVPQVTTLHGRLDIPDLVPLYREFSEMPVISISDAQREPLPWLNWQATIHHGLPVDLLYFHPDPGEYLAFLGRISPEKGVDRAIEIAIKLDMPLRIAAKVDRADREYYQAVIEPRLDHRLIEYVGEIGDREKDEFLGRARAVLFPVDWPEPFGLTMIEALACGAPVIAYSHGSVPEVIEHGKTGFLVSSIEEAVEAVKQIEHIDRAVCRGEFVRRFSAGRMAHDYICAYQRLAGMPSALAAVDAVAGVAHG
jgi:glycosyltransferase involved in cell wall biosynthesis